MRHLTVGSLSTSLDRATRWLLVSAAGAAAVDGGGAALGKAETLQRSSERPK